MDPLYNIDLIRMDQATANTLHTKTGTLPKASYFVVFFAVHNTRGASAFV